MKRITILSSLVVLILTTSFQPDKPTISYIGGDLPTATVVDSATIPDHLMGDYIALVRTLQAECIGESFEGKWAAADVIVYRSVYKGRRISDEISNKRTFNGYGNEKYWRTLGDDLTPMTERAIKDCMEVARLSMVGKHILPYGVMYFHNPFKDQYGNWISTDRKHVRRMERHEYCIIGNHMFCWEPKLYNMRQQIKHINIEYTKIGEVN